MKYYYGFFRDTNSNNDPEGQLYKVVIKTKKGSGVGELLLSGSPFTVEYEQSDIYKPYKCSTATIGLLNKDYNKDFICESIKDNEVYLYRLKDGESFNDELKLEASDDQYFTLEWFGYTTPNAYSQGYASYLDKFQLECQDRLSIIKYYKWDKVITIAPNSRVNLFNILMNTSIFLGISKLYITKSLNIPQPYEEGDGSDSYSFSTNAYFLKSSFSDKDDKKYMSEVIESVLSYFSLSLIQIKDNLYLVNYNAIASGFTDYLYVNLRNLKMGTTTIEKEYTIEKEDSAKNDTNLSIVESYNEFEISSDIEEVDRSLPEVEWYDKTPSEYVDSLYADCEGRLVVGVGANHIVHLTKMAEWDGYSVYQQRGDANVYGYTSLQFYNFSDTALLNREYSPEIKFYTYLEDVSVTANGWVCGNEDTTAIPGQWQLVETTNGKSIRNHVASMPMSYAILSNDDWNIGQDKEHEDGLFICHPVSNVSMMSDSEWSNLINNDSVILQQPMIDLVYNDVSITKGHPLCWKCNVEYFPDYIPCAYKPNSTISHYMNWFNLSIILETGDRTLYYDEANNEWTNFVTINRPHLDGIEYQGEVYSGKHKFNNNSQNRFNVRKYDDGIVISGGGAEYSGKLTIRLYRPFGPDQSFSHITTSTMLTGVSLVELDTINYNTFPSDDTIYSYTDPEKFINEKYEETLGYNTSSNKVNSKNRVFTKESGGTLKPLDYILDIPAGDVFKPEEQRLRDYVKQLITPTFSLITTGHCDVDMITKVYYNRFPDCRFVVTGLSIDYGYDTKTYTITDKK